MSRLKTSGRLGQSIFGSSLTSSSVISTVAPFCSRPTIAKPRAAASFLFNSVKRTMGVELAIETQVLSFRLKARPSKCATGSREPSGQARRIRE